MAPLRTIQVVAQANLVTSITGNDVVRLLFIPIILAGSLALLKFRKRYLKSRVHINRVVKITDAKWDKQVLVARATATFERFQRDLSSFNTDSMDTYMTHHYHAHMRLLLFALKNMNRQNFRKGLKLYYLKLVNVSDHIDKEMDRFDVELSATAEDVILNHKTKRELYKAARQYIEVWHFKREDGDWKLDGISPEDYTYTFGGEIATAPHRFQSSSNEARMRTFAVTNGLFYDDYLSWLLLPQAGQLFKAARYGRSEIRNHVTGLYQKQTVQFFDYVPIRREVRSTFDRINHFLGSTKKYRTYHIASITLPESYSDVIVRQKRLLGATTPRSMKKVNRSLPKLRRRYEILASNIEKATKLTLIDPPFMSKLAAMDARYDMEIVDDVLYLVTTNKNPDPERAYQLLKDALKAVR